VTDGENWAGAMLGGDYVKTLRALTLWNGHFGPGLVAVKTLSAMSPPRGGIEFLAPAADAVLYAVRMAVLDKLREVRWPTFIAAAGIVFGMALIGFAGGWFWRAGEVASKDREIAGRLHHDGGRGTRRLPGREG
jgi:hypothetical protein